MTMIKVAVLYPNNAGNKFDMKYYMEKHIPMVRQKMGPALKNVAVEQGVSGGMPGSPITYTVMCHLSFDSLDAFQGAFAVHAPQIMGDVVNYTNIQPVVQISEVKI
jgi:uncharacterized protein (TIGR02118 family)